MRTCVFDLESSSLYANSGIILCAVIKEFTYEKKRNIIPFKRIIRADEYPSWKHSRTDNAQVVFDIMQTLIGDGKLNSKNDGFDVFVAHNGQYFDKTWLNTACIKYGLPPSLRFEKFIDPFQLGKKHLRLARNSLTAMLDYFDIPEEKTPIRFKYWMEASMNGDRKAMDYIVQHCEADVDALEAVYRKVRKLVKGIDERGSQ